MRGTVHSFKSRQCYGICCRFTSEKSNTHCALNTVPYGDLQISRCKLATLVTVSFMRLSVISQFPPRHLFRSILMICDRLSVRWTASLNRPSLRPSQEGPVHSPQSEEALMQSRVTSGALSKCPVLCHVDIFTSSLKTRTSSCLIPTFRT